MNNLDKEYQMLLEYILGNGVEKKDRTGTGTLSVFGTQIRHNMSDGFPLLTGKKMFFKGIVTELLWFLRGDTNIKFLVDNDCHIWNGDAWANYSKKIIANNLQLMPASDLPKTKEEFINKIKTDDEFAKTWGELGPVYGKQWRDWGGEFSLHIGDWGGEFSLHIGLERDGSQDKINFKKGVDQISELIRLLKKNPDSRRMVVSAWAVHDLPNMVLPPCHYGFQVYTRELSNEEKWEQYTKSGLNIEINGTPLELKHMGTPFYPKSLPQRAISLMWNQRSVDTFLGLPFNIASYGLLLEIIAKEVNMVPDELIGNLGDTHLYLNHIEQAKEQVERKPYSLPKLEINPTLFEFGKPDPNKLNLDYYSIHNFELLNYQSHPSIKAPLSN